jgi:hypothetical protein
MRSRAIRAEVGLELSVSRWIPIHAAGSLPFPWHTGQIYLEMLMTDGTGEDVDCQVRTIVLLEFFLGLLNLSSFAPMVE